MKYIMDLIKSYRVRSLVLVILVTICNVAALLYNYSFKFVIDAIEQKNLYDVWRYFFCLLFFQILVEVLTLLVYDYYLRVFQKNIERHIRNDIISGILAWSYSKSKDMTQGNLSTLMVNDAAQMGQYVSLYDFMLIANTIRFLITYFLLFSLDGVIGVIVLLSVPFYYFLTKFTMNPMKKFVKEEYEAKDVLNTSFLDILNNLMNIKSYKIEDISNRYIQKKNAEIYKKEKSLQKWTAIFYFIRNFLSSFLPVFILGVSVIRIVEGNMTVGTLVAIFGFLSAVYLPISEIFQFVAMKNNLEPVIERINPIVNDKLDETDKRTNGVGKPAIFIQNLSYSLGENTIMKNFSVNLEGIGIYRLSGHNGIGKSTLFNIISGLYNDFDGELEINVRSEAPNIAYMNQKDILFDTNIEDNITLFNSLSMNRLSERILKKVQNKSDNVNELSGGEKRLILFLRTVNANASIFLFDEPFEGVDDETRKAMKEILETLALDNMVLIISHNDNDFSDIRYNKIELSDI